jgi:hypothetical protein
MFYGILQYNTINAMLIHKCQKSIILIRRHYRRPPKSIYKSRCLQSVVPIDIRRRAGAHLSIVKNSVAAFRRLDQIEKHLVWVQLILLSRTASGVYTSHLIIHRLLNLKMERPVPVNGISSSRHCKLLAPQSHYRRIQTYSWPGSHDSALLPAPSSPD